MTTARGRATTALWTLLWLAIAVLFAAQALDAWQRQAPALVWIAKLGPLLVVLPGVFRDKLRSMVWLSFVVLLYFLFAVQRIFAEPDSVRAIAELCAVVAIFMCTMFYVRYRAREQRVAAPEESL
jgi:uncharacterized membrane protein